MSQLLDCLCQCVTLVFFFVLLFRHGGTGLGLCIVRSLVSAELSLLLLVIDINSDLIIRKSSPSLSEISASNKEKKVQTYKDIGGFTIISVFYFFLYRKYMHEMLSRLKLQLQFQYSFVSTLLTHNHIYARFVRWGEKSR